MCTTVSLVEAGMGVAAIVLAAQRPPGSGRCTAGKTYYFALCRLSTQARPTSVTGGPASLRPAVGARAQAESKKSAQLGGWMQQV